MILRLLAKTLIVAAAVAAGLGVLVYIIQLPTNIAARSAAPFFVVAGPLALPGLIMLLLGRR